MADFRSIQEGIRSGYQIGRSAGGRLGGLASTISKVADALKQRREKREGLAEEQYTLGVKGLLEGKLEKTKEGGYDIPGVGRVKQRMTSKEQADDVESNIKLKIARGEQLTDAEKDFYNKTMLSTFNREPYKIPGPADAQPVDSGTQKPPAPTGALNPLRALPGYAAYGQDKEGAYKSLRAHGISEEEAMKRSGFKKGEGSRDKAIQELKKNGYPLTENNILAVIKQMQ